MTSYQSVAPVWRTSSINWCYALVLALCLALSACSTTGSLKSADGAGASQQSSADEQDSTGVNKDPFEGFNRVMFNFNTSVDQHVLKPAAEFYRAVTPSFVQTGISNFFGNIGDVWTAVNNMLQGNFVDGTNDVMRVAVNSTLGLGGLLDISTPAGLRRHKEDFGQTLGAWGVPAGPYLVLPLLGPSTLRDAVATPVDFAGDPWDYKRPMHVRNTGIVVKNVDLRASVLDAASLIQDAALDQYVFMRDAYLQRRENEIHPDKD